MKIGELCPNICPSWPKFVVFSRTSPNCAKICYIFLFNRVWGRPWGRRLRTNSPPKPIFCTDSPPSDDFRRPLGRAVPKKTEARCKVKTWALNFTYFSCSFLYHDSYFLIPKSFQKVKQREIKTEHGDNMEWSNLTNVRNKLWGGTVCSFRFFSWRTKIWLAK